MVVAVFLCLTLVVAVVAKSSYGDLKCGAFAREPGTIKIENEAITLAEFRTLVSDLSEDCASVVVVGGPDTDDAVVVQPRLNLGDSIRIPHSTVIEVKTERR